MPDPQTQEQSDLTLSDYLDTLLAEIDEQAVSVVAETRVKAIPEQVDTLQESLAEPAPTVEVERAVSSGDGQQSVVPGWAEAPFQVLLFSVQGVNLAVPLTELLGILPLQEQISHLPGQPSWAMGVTLNREANKVVVVDTGRLLMSGSGASQRNDRAYTHLLLIGDGARALAVDGLNGTEWLDNTAVRWRGAGGIRQPWYAGIVSERLTAMIDVDGILRMLEAEA